MAGNTLYTVLIAAAVILAVKAQDYDDWIKKQETLGAELKINCSEYTLPNHILKKKSTGLNSRSKG